MTKITPCLWFDDRIDEAIGFYTETFKSAKVHEVVRQAPDRPAFTAVIELEGHRFMLLNGSRNGEATAFPFTQAISFMIDCEGQQEVDYFWDKFVGEGGKESMCGWCSDKFGLSWQIVPKQIFETVFGPDPAGAKRAMDAMLQMRKLDVAALQKAYAGA